MKNKRHEKILEIIKNNDVETQDELQSRLAYNGFDVAQATISRDIRQLNIVKTVSERGKYRYVQKISQDFALENKFATILKETVKEVRLAMNIVVIKAYTGMASAACTAIDAMNISEVVGSVAGDDTLILVTESVEDAKRLHQMIVSDINA